MTDGRSKPEATRADHARIEFLDSLDQFRPSEAFEHRELERLRALNTLLAREVASLREREAQALRLADRDPLTGLYNRRKLRQLLDEAIASARQQSRAVGLLFI